MATKSTLCVLREGEHEKWSVWLCKGFGQRQHLGDFEDRVTASDFAISEAGRRSEGGEEIEMHLPDDCPCYPEHIRLQEKSLQLKLNSQPAKASQAREEK